MPQLLKDWFCLQPSRQNFKPDARRDRQLLFCHTDEIEEQARYGIERSFAIGEPVKMIIYGNWGVGKTHAVHHISWWLEEHDDYTAKTVFVEVGDITKKSKFDVLLRRFLDEIGMDEISRLVSEYTVSTGTNPREGLRNIGVGHDIVEAYFKFIMSPPGQTPVPATEHAFEHLKGGFVKDGTSSGITSRLEQSTEFFDVLKAIGHLYQAVDATSLIFIADEAAKLEDLEADEATAAHWQATNRLIFDDANSYFGFIYTLAAAAEKNLPRVLTAPQIMNRLGPQNLIQLAELNGPQTTDFLTRLVSQFVDKAALESLEDAGEFDGTFDEATYPFTPTAHARFIDYWKRNPEDAKPRDITDRMNDAAFIAMKKGSRLIDDSALEKAGL